ncbi:signal peptidase II, partial [Methylophilaceae bacterium]|nr:signal peptidase II [Methylophilaceae bacterium]
GLTLILGGAIGNLIDRLLHGYVIDFVSLHRDNIFYWPAFNVADSTITIGAAFIIFDSFIKKKH